MYQKIIELLRIHGYMKNDTETGPCYVKNINGRNKCVFVIFDKNPDGSSILEEDLYHLEDHARQLFGMDCAVLTLILSQDDKPVFLDPKDQFDDLYGPLSIVLAQNEASQAGQESEIEVKDNKSVKDFWKSLYQYKATLLIFTANLICFILTETYGDKIYDSFACNAYRVKKLHEYYRLFTSYYLHFGWDHFFNNMAVFLLLGSSLEKVIGSVRYVILYTGAGIAGSIISVAYYSMIGQDVLSAGASGACSNIFILQRTTTEIRWIWNLSNDRRKSVSWIPEWNNRQCSSYRWMYCWIYFVNASVRVGQLNCCS